MNSLYFQPPMMWQEDTTNAFLMDNPTPLPVIQKFGELRISELGVLKIHCTLLNYLDQKCDVWLHGSVLYNVYRTEYTHAAQNYRKKIVL